MTGDASSGIAGDLRGVSPSLGRRGARRTSRVATEKLHRSIDLANRKTAEGPLSGRFDNPYHMRTGVLFEFAQLIAPVEFQP